MAKTKKEEGAELAPEIPAEARDGGALAPDGARAGGGATAEAPGGPAAPEALMYVGPTIPGVATQNRVYTEVPQGAAEAAKRLPELGNLFLPVRRYPMACRMLREQKGYIYNAFQKALSLRGGDNSNE